MTRNQMKWHEIRETHRANVAKEDETRRHNLADEEISRKFNRGSAAMNDLSKFTDSARNVASVLKTIL